MKRKRAYLFTLAVGFAAMAAGQACSKAASPAGEGQACAQTTDCDEGLVCIPQPDGSRQCSNNLSSIQHTEEAGSDGGEMDAPAPTPDAKTPPVDASMPPVDSSMPPKDTGSPPQDAGVKETAPPQDTGSPPMDTGAPIDTGSPPQDTGSPPQDTGTPPTDAASD